MIKLHDVEQGSEQWHILRAPFYTGSHADKLLKFGAIEYSRAESRFNGNFYTKRGHILEDEALDIYQQIKKEIGIRLESGRKVGFVTNSKFPSCGYSPDDLYPDRTVEVKAFKEDLHLKMIAGDIPFKVLAQVHFAMLICGKKVCHLLPYNPDIDDPKKAFKIITIKYNPRIAANFKKILSKPVLEGAVR